MSTLRRTPSFRRLILLILALILAVVGTACGGERSGTPVTSSSAAGDVCGEDLPPLTGLDELLARPEPVQATVCRYGEEGLAVASASGSAAPLLAALRDLATTPEPTNRPCPLGAVSPYAVVVSFADGDTLPIVISRGGCASVVEPDGELLLNAAARRAIAELPAIPVADDTATSERLPSPS